jgi:hypothetical protein
MPTATPAQAPTIVEPIGFAAPNMTQPLVQPNINAEIESQIPKKKKSKKKLAEVPKSEKVSVQMECPKDLSKLPVGANCWKDGRLYKVVSSKRERDEVYPAVVPEKHGASPKETREILRQYPSLTVPPYFPGRVTVSPTDQNEPYPAESEESPPLIPKPGKTLRPPQSSQTLTPTPPSSPPSPPAPPYGPSPSGKPAYYIDKPWDKKEAAGRPSIRVLGPNPTGNYRLVGSVVVGTNPKQSGTGHGSPTTEITSGGPGSADGNCCGITLGVKNDQGTVFAATEDWTAEGRSNGEHKYLCDDSLHPQKCNGVPVPPCTTRGARVAGTNKDGSLWGQRVNISWFQSHRNPSALRSQRKTDREVGQGGTESNASEPYSILRPESHGSTLTHGGPRALAKIVQKVGGETVEAGKALLGIKGK